MIPSIHCFTRIKKKEDLISFKAENIGVNWRFQTILVFQKQRQAVSYQVADVAEYILNQL